MRLVPGLAHGFENGGLARRIDGDFGRTDVHLLDLGAFHLLNRLAHPLDARLAVHSVNSELHTTILAKMVESGGRKLDGMDIFP
jgi:hypothetical protein